MSAATSSGLRRVVSSRVLSKEPYGDCRHVLLLLLGPHSPVRESMTDLDRDQVGELVEGLSGRLREGRERLVGELSDQPRQQIFRAV